MLNLKIFFLILFTISLTNCVKKINQLKVEEKKIEDKITIGEKVKIYSKILGEDREIWISVPSSPSYYSPKKYPVLYLLDGKIHFASTFGIIEQLSSANLNTVCPEMIVVGILNTNRTRDLTTSKDTISINKKYFTNSGGGEKFMSFIEKELIPFIDSTYSTAPYRLFVGHSFGGITVTNAFLKYNHLFNAFVAIDPSFWWDNQKLMKEFVLTANNFRDKKLYIGMANTFLNGATKESVLGDTATHSPPGLSVR